MKVNFPTPTEMNLDLRQAFLRYVVWFFVICCVFFVCARAVCESSQVRSREDDIAMSGNCSQHAVVEVNESFLFYCTLLMIPVWIATC